MKPLTLARTVILSAAAILGACSLPQAARTPLTTWDFGLLQAGAQPGAARLKGSLLVLNVDAPAWLDTPAMYYRLAYAEAAEPRAYATSRWIASPPALITERLRAAAAASGAIVLAPGDGIRAERTLRVELEEFTQVFDSASASRGVLHLRATLLGGGKLLGQQSFEIAVPAASADARGAAGALALASSQTVTRIIAWMASL